ncbi:MAG: hypothetical protein SGPRY_005506 [Prymnesium sp.]
MSSSKHLKVKGKHMIMGRAYRGLYGLKHIQFGNKISFSHTNEVLEKPLVFRMTTSIKRMENGIDEYLLRTPDEARRKLASCTRA